jgi:3-oxoacyl-[acyl-carrier-protein] synthase-3
MAGIAGNVLLLTAETYSKWIHPKDKGNRTIFGDAASATLISTVGFAEIGEFCLGTDGSGAENLMLKNGGVRFPQKTYYNKIDDGSDSINSDDYIYMNGSEIFSFSLSVVPRLVKDTLFKNGWEKEDVGLFIFHQANKYMLDSLRKKMNISEESFYEYLSEVGNTVSSTIPIAFYESIEERKVRKGMKVLMTGFGVGLSWGSVGISIIE